MEIIQRQCKLCCTTTGDESFKVIDDVIKDVFEVLFQKMRFDEESQNVVCKVCFSKVLTAFNFKSTCLNTDDTIVPYVDLEKSNAVDLNEVYGKEKGWKNQNGISKDMKICRLCFELMGSKHRLLQEVPQGNVDIFIPEINFALTTSTAICTKCYDLLCIHGTFIKTCLESEEKSHVTETLTNFYVKMEEVEIRSEESVEETLVENDLKKRGNEKRNTSPCKYVTSEDCDDCLSKLGHKNTSQNVCRRTPKRILKKLKVPDQDHPKNWSLKVQMLSCDKSTFETKNERYLSIHLLRHKDLSKVKTCSCDKCTFITKRKNRINQNTSVETQDPSEVKMFKCDKCKFETKYKSNLVKHCLTHQDPSQVQVFKCDECDYKSIRKGHLQRHQLNHKDPSEVQMYECDGCKYKTKHKSNFMKHSLIHKERVALFKCDECSYKSIRKQNLLQHQLTHKDLSEVRMFKCDECDYKSILKVNLNRHKLRHKNPLEVRMFKCDECDFKSIHKGSLQCHQLRHKDPSEVQMYSCSECGYTSNQKTNLVKHQLVHKDPSERQIYRCDKCTFKTIRKKSLKVHQLTHVNPSEVQMYRCDKCTFKTIHKISFKRHQLTHIDTSLVQI